MSNLHNEQKDPVKQLQEKPRKGEFLIVGIGASAGGIQALHEFFKHVPHDSGMAYVVILHLSPDHDSHLAEILQQVTSIPVSQVIEKVLIQPNQIYVVSPNKHLTINDSHIIVSPNMQVEDRRAPVDIFFRTLADEMGPRAVCVVLSGTGANGSNGLKRIKERGGTTFVQNPREAEFSEMPRNSIATDLVDEVLPVADIPAKIMAYKNSLGTLQIAEEAERRPEDHQQALREIFTLLRTRTGHDFSNYKRPTLLRRIERRINVRNLPDLTSYSKYVRENAEEANALLKDLLISVTNFFRNKPAFEAIETEVLPVILKNKNGENQLRIWVAGCATGEEAYSIAMLCAEKTMDVLDSPKIQIFATDIDEAAIAHAREGFYTLNDTADVSPERLRHFFNKEGDGYRIRREIRENVMFANHNFLKDPPFSHLDLVCCRNVMIYLNRSAQERVIETFHFALNPGCFLFLGSSESVDGTSDLYAAYNRDYHIFQSRQVSPKIYPVPESVPNLYFNKKNNIEKLPSLAENKIRERISFGELHQQLLEQYAPPSLVINEEYDIVHITEKAGKYLQIGGGEISQNLLKLVKPELRLELRSALYQAMQRHSAVEARGLKVGMGDKTEIVNIHVRPVLAADDIARGFMLVMFEPTVNEEKQEILLSTDEPLAKKLEEELTRLKMQLRTSGEQHEFQAEELKASNEELQAMNEELRSAAEELETSKEELQSMNEELRTVNQELKVKVEEVTIAKDNLQNLINSTDVGTIFLDRSFRVSLFTPAARQIFNLIPADYGRPLTDITNRLNHPDLLKDAEKVLDKLAISESEVNTEDGTVYLMRMTPYRTDDDRIKGVVITFLDISERKKIEQRIREERAYAEAIIATVREPLIVLNKDLRIVSASHSFYEDFKVTPQESEGKFIYELGNRQWDIPDLKDLLENIIPQKNQFEDFEVQQKFEKLGQRIMLLNAREIRRDGENQQLILLAIEDITDRRNEEKRQQFFLNLSDSIRSMYKPKEKLHAATKLAMDFFNTDRCYYCEIEDDKVIIRSDAHVEGLDSVAGIFPPENFQLFKNVITEGRSFVIPDVRDSNMDEELRQFCIQLQIISFVDIPVIKNDKTVGIFCLVQSNPRSWTDFEIDLAAETAERIWIAMENAKADVALKKSEEKYVNLFNSIDEGFCLIEMIFDENENAEDYRFLEVNNAFEKQTGLQNAVGKRMKELAPDHEKYWFESYGRIAKTGKPERFENEAKALGRTYEVYAFPASSHDKNRIAIIFQDISERKLMEQQREDFMSIASHELKTPVTSISVYGELLQELIRNDQKEKSLDFVSKLNSQIRRLKNLIGDLLDTTKINEGRVELHYETFSLNKLVSQIMEEFGQISENHQLKTECKSRITLSADKGRIGQVITNLVSNAIKYSKKGTVTIACEKQKNEVKISVSDEGVGIPEKVQEKLFGRFFRVHQQNSNTYPGMGLGLYISSGIIHSHGGKMGVESAEGKGSVFYFTLPLHKE